MNLSNSKRPVFCLFDLHIRAMNLQKEKTCHGQGDSSIHMNTRLVRNNFCTVPINSSKTIFCKRSHELNQHLESLHKKMIANPDDAIQNKIDSFLFCVHYLDNIIPADRPLSHKAVRNIIELFRTATYTTPNVGTSPDILYSFSFRIIHGQWENPLFEQTCRHVFPCLQKTKWINRQRKDAMNYDPGQPAIFIRILLAMLMGFYPTCSKKPLFSHRIHFIVSIRDLLLKSDEKQYEFILQNINLIRLSVAEYATFALQLLPVEYSLMSQHFDVDTYLNLCHACCEIFRVCLMQEKQLSWFQLEDIAFKSVDKIVRSARIGQKMSIPHVASQTIIKKFLNVDCKKKPANVNLLLEVAKKCPLGYAHHESQFLYGKLVEHIMKNDADSFLSSPGIQKSLPVVIQNIHGVLTTFDMPLNLVIKQMATLCKKYETSPIKLLNVTCKYVCIDCMLRMTAKQFFVEEKINGMIRMNFGTDEIICNKCMRTEHIVKIDMLGKILRLNQTIIFVCPTCGEIEMWKGDGLDLLHCRKKKFRSFNLVSEIEEYDPTLTYVRGIKSAIENMEETSNKKVKKKQYSKKRESCFNCTSGTSNKFIVLLHVPSAMYLKIFLCGKHIPPQHVMPYIQTCDDFERWSYQEALSCEQATSGLGKNRGNMAKLDFKRFK